MNRVVIVFLCVIVLLAAANCKKSTTKNSAICTGATGGCITHPLDADSVMYFVPTAFTPNGDGLNDIFRVTFHNLVADSSTITIWDLNGKEVYAGYVSTNNHANGWDGTDFSGNKCPAGLYPVYVQLLTNKGIIVNECTSVTLLQYTGKCIKGNAAAYKFEDQINVDSGFVYQTNDVFCQ